MGIQISAVTMENSMQFLKRLKTELQYDPAIHFWIPIQRKKNPLIEKDTCITMFTAAVLWIAKIWNLPKCWWIDTEICHKNVHYVILLSHKKEWNLAICNNMDRPRSIRLSEISQRQTLYDFTYTWNLKNKWANITKQKQSQIQWTNR